jgi:hypothetical protein
MFKKLLDYTIKAGLLGSFLLAFLYFFGYLFLSFYFKTYGLLINISDINFTEIVLIGVPVFIFGIFIFYLIFLIKKLFLKKTQIKTSGFIIIIILFFILQILGNIFSAVWLYNHGYVYNYFLKFHNKLPAIEIIYSTPLNISNEKEIKKDNNENNLKCKIISIKSSKTGEGRFQVDSEDNFFYDQSGIIKYFGAFTLFLSTDKFYYLYPSQNFFKGSSFNDIIFEDLECDGKKIDEAKITIQTIFNNMYKLIILPKDKVESMKFLGIEGKLGVFKY